MRHLPRRPGQPLPRRPPPAHSRAVPGPARQLGYASDYLIDDGHVWTHGLGEQRRYAIQHALGYQIWELDQPHFPHAHGRSLTGHHPTGTERGELAALRQHFTARARQDDD